MNLSLNNLVVVTSGLIVAAGISGCQTRSLIRVPKPFSISRPAPVRSQPPAYDERDVGRDSGIEYEPNTIVEPRLTLPPEPAPQNTIAPDTRPLPAPPTDDVETSRTGARWFPARPRRTTESDDFGLPPARVTYSTTENANDDLDAETNNRPQPKLFRPATNAKNVLEAVKRKMPWQETH